jgi:ribonuclease HI
MTLWLKRWKKNGWKTKTGTPIANRDLLERLNQLMGQIRVQFEKVEGHSDDYGNDQADQLAREGAKLYTRQ